ncbi:CoA-disulfide reductase [Spiroplasma tabanidicola]|uniref:NADH oxidase n=1 Tax=Spiroplasma tabanidicola TaxID=324079 RepID=A0A6I6CBN7_9MOLU|nr:CoA-disulfide reductase [Spiroplasma tabanidicola]QGS52391.1 NADH oxidase [Spiroplasma tabanidicola]
MKIVILGGGATGMGVAAKVKRNDKNCEVLVIETGNYVSLGACGLPYYVGKNFDEPNMLFARTIEKFNESGIEIIINSKIKLIDLKNKKVVVNNKEITFDKLVIATGADAISPNIKGLNTIEHFKLTKFEDGLALRNIVEKKNINNILIVGSGFIGLELAENLKDLNKNVTMVEIEKDILSNLYDAEISELIKTTLEKNKINLMLNSFVNNFYKKENKVIANISDKEYEFDLVITATGFKPNTELLLNTGLNFYKNNAIIVDEFGKTNIEDVYAGGDCCAIMNKITNQFCYSPLATVASKQAKVIANNICKIESRFNGTIQSSIIRLFDKAIARCGLTVREANDLNIKTKVSYIKDKDHTHYLKGQSDVHLKLIMNEDTHELIGAQMFSHKDSILRFYSLATMVWSKIKVNEALEQIDLPYSPPFAKSFDIIHIAISKFI